MNSSIPKHLGRIAIIGEFQVLGINELIHKKPFRETSVTCISQSAKAYFITEKDFLRLELLKVFESNQYVD